MIGVPYFGSAARIPTVESSHAPAVAVECPVRVPPHAVGGVDACTAHHASTPELICGAAAAWCRCGLDPGHDGAHVCAEACCGSSWSGVYGGDDFIIERFPGEQP